jgi:hypothetical protein
MTPSYHVPERVAQDEPRQGREFGKVKSAPRRRSSPEVVAIPIYCCPRVCMETEIVAGDLKYATVPLEK